MQPSIFDVQPTFDGPGLIPSDHADLHGDLLRVRDCLATGRWLTLEELAADTGVSLVSVGSRVRDLRKLKFGGYDVQRRRRDGCKRTWEYRMERQA